MFIIDLAPEKKKISYSQLFLGLQYSVFENNWYGKSHSSLAAI